MEKIATDTNTHIWENSKTRKREIQNSNGILQQVLLPPFGLRSSADLRKEYSAFARNTTKEAADGRTGIYSRCLPASKTSIELSDYDFTAIDQAWKTMHSFLPGSLAHFLLTLHALGFRTYPKSAAVSSFLSHAKIAGPEHNLLIALKKQNLLTLPLMTITSLYSQLTTPIRGKGADSYPEPLAIRFYSAFTGKPVGKDNKTTEWTFCQELSSAICDKWKTWKEINTSPVDAIKLVEAKLKDYNLSVSLSSACKLLVESNSVEGTLKNSTIAFDPNAPRFDPSLNPSHVLIALCVRYGQEAHIKGVKVSSYIQESITTQKANGLSWLFNKGIQLIPEADSHELESSIGVEKDSPEFNELLVAINGIQLPELFASPIATLKTARIELQGRIDSFIANHIARLGKSLEILSAIQDRSDWSDWISNHIELAETLPGLSQLAASLVKSPKVIQEGINASKFLLGMTDEVITQEAVTSSINGYTLCLSFLDYIASAIGQINGAIKNGTMNGKIFDDSVFEGLVALPIINDPVVEIAEDRVLKQKELKDVLAEFHDVLSTLNAEYKISFEQALLNRAESLRNVCKKTKKTALQDPMIVAFRDQFSRVCRSGYALSSKAQKQVIDKLSKLNIAADNAELREHIKERKHFVFVHPLDRKPKKLIAINNVNVDLIDVLNDLLSLELDERDRLQLLLCKSSIELQALPDTIKTSLIKTDLIKTSGNSRYLTLLEYESIERYAAQTLISGTYKSKVNGLLYSLNKKQFSLNRSLYPYETPKLFYIPKAKPWKIPEHRMEGRFQHIIENIVEWESDGVVNVIKTASKLINAKDIVTEEKLAFLKEMPHNYGVEAGLRNVGETAKACLINKGEVSALREIEGLIKISIPRNDKTAVKAIEDWMAGGKVSPPSIKFTREYCESDGELVERTDKRAILFNLPNTEVQDVTDAPLVAQHILAVDPGRYGMGLALLTLDGELVDSGYLHVNSLIKYADKKEGHITKSQPKQQYKSKHSTYLENASEAAAGDIQAVLDKMIVKFNAIPVIEMVSSQEVTENVWNKVVAKYTWGDNDAQNAMRKTHWFGATHFDYANVLRNAPSDASKKHKPYTGYPGSRVGSAGNSQCCSSCGRNPIDAVKSLVTSTAEARIQGGVLQTEQGQLTLENPNPETAKQRKERGLSPEWTTVGDRTFSKLKGNSDSAKDLLTIVRRSIRRAPANKKTTQGIASIYKCAFADCGVTLNSEQNAAINAGKKFAKQLKITENEPTT